MGFRARKSIKGRGISPGIFYISANEPKANTAFFSTYGNRKKNFLKKLSKKRM